MMAETKRRGAPRRNRRHRCGRGTVVDAERVGGVV